MIEFKEFQTQTFKEKFTSTQLVFIFSDALHFLDSFIEGHSGVTCLDCTISSDRFVIRARIRDFDKLPTLINWFTCQFVAYRSVKKDCSPSIEILPSSDASSFVDIRYSIFTNLPFYD